MVDPTLFQPAWLRTRHYMADPLSNLAVSLLTLRVPSPPFDRLVAAAVAACGAVLTRVAAATDARRVGPDSDSPQHTACMKQESS